MKLMIFSAYSGLLNRGVETVVSELTKQLKDKVYVWKVVGGPVEDEFTIGIPIKLVREGSRWSERFFVSEKRRREFWFYLQGIKYLWFIRPDVVFIYNGGWHLVLYKLLSGVLRFRLVLSGQSGPGWDDRFNLLVHPDAFVCLSNYQKDWARRVGGRVRCFVIPNGVRTEVFYPSKSRKREYKVLGVAACERAKNIDQVLYGLTKTKYQYLHIGSGSIEKKIDRLGEKLLGARYRRISLPHSDLPKIYRSADYFVFLQSSFEAFGIVFIEAMASGLPIVCFDDPIRRELLGRNAIYIKSSEELPEALLSASKLKTEMKTVSKYDWRAIANQYYKMIMEL